MPRNAVDHTGKKFDRLYVLRRDTSKKNRSYWICQCQCGVTLSARASHLISGVVPSCGCRRRELISQLSTKHGHYAGNKASITYKSWSSMHDRCGKYKGYKTVSICKEWSDFASSIPLIGFARLAIMNLEIVVGRQPLSKTETSQTITGLRTRAKLLL
jgi:hypothetical protein